MAAAAPSRTVTHPWLKGDHLPLTILMIIGILIMVFSEVGFRLGWWNHLHTPAFFIGLALTVLTGLVNYSLGATGKQVSAIGQNVTAMRTELRQVGSDVRQVGSDVRQVSVEVRDARTDIVAHQERQTEQQERQTEQQELQTELLVQIRDRLPPR